jgi:transcriptional regulator of acetoin/glycerol metabolism
VAPPFESTLTVQGRSAEVDAPRIAPQLFLVLECSRPLALSARCSLEGVDAVIIGRGRERAVTLGEEGGRAVLRFTVPDARMSSSHARLERGLGHWTIEDADSKNGTLLNGAVVKRARIADGDLLALGYSLFTFRHAAPVVGAARLLDAGADPRPPGLATVVPELERELARVAQLAPSNVTVMLSGETGTGKEVMARAIHALSGRSGAFVAVNCGALPDTLIESELFGHRKGAFSGAVDDSPGLIRAADGGTLLLDEIGDLPLASQAAFLRVLQEREVVPVGSTRPIKVDVRLISATHRDLDERVRAGAFRADLLARIGGFHLELPALRERREDLGILIGALLVRLAGPRAAGVALSEEVARALYHHDWPHNIRELEKVLDSALVLAGDDSSIELEHLGDALRQPAAPAEDDPAELRDRLVAMLAQHGGNVSAVARAMGKARMQIHRWIKRFELSLDDYRR